jgi:hypothetical protein
VLSGKAEQVGHLFSGDWLACVRRATRGTRVAACLVCAQALRAQCVHVLGADTTRAATGRGTRLVWVSEPGRGTPRCRAGVFRTVHQLLLSAHSLAGREHLGGDRDTPTCACANACTAGRAAWNWCDEKRRGLPTLSRAHRCALLGPAASCSHSHTRRACTARDAAQAVCVLECQQAVDARARLRARASPPPSSACLADGTVVATLTPWSVTLAPSERRGYERRGW